jgi:hypothetical protein
MLLCKRRYADTPIRFPCRAAVRTLANAVKKTYGPKKLSP